MYLCLLLSVVCVTRKALRPCPWFSLPSFSLPSGCKICYGHSRYESKWCSGSLQRIFVWPSENRESGASSRQKTRKAPWALHPPLFFLFTGCKIYYSHQRYEPKWCNGSLWRESGSIVHENKRRRRRTRKKKRGVLLDPVLTAG